MNDPLPNPPESNGSPDSNRLAESDSAPVSKGTQPNNPLHGVTLKAMVEYLVDEYGWERLGERIRIDCFTYDPSINSSLKFLRKTEWARAKVERLYLDSISYDERKGKKQAEPTDVPKKTGSVWDQARRS
ncbi:VF530 family protein [Rhodopirellula sp. P2]|uniref:VF530 family protein n=1 Tax=Rhodopirellula sp. P2 TaxID=2127060 RepID=UPI0023680E7B|nr:VF530 family protein [Rhodopirellula sp. P2]WDQ17774.1 VF530 family protein [Rhodopirellula sp. P2]